ncbi:uroporphyrin-III C-methyltransferase / precorrin-2 dehydrogenase / sirohydrochlorin ferrochelatase [Burkholderiales bacterium]|nr:uroporphyrin-III C-methyltransferase / precorrin-2 dehydrogenase / sirohydrochlorin ferrochelatase [Burkholderiales bacterium]
MPAPRLRMRVPAPAEAAAAGRRTERRREVLARSKGRATDGGAPHAHAAGTAGAGGEATNGRIPSRAARAPRRGFVSLVGAGPGDPELLTLRAARLLAEADACVYDHLVGDGVLALLRPDAERLYAGKERSNHTLPQEDINALLVRLAHEGKRVVRLKGGDPFVFGRGGEEAQSLAQAGVAFEIVPGVTAACGIAAATRIPLTHRDHAHTLTFVAGHLRDGTMNLDWPSLARPGQTLVVYMGLAGLPELCRQLVAHGRAPSTPAAVVQQGTLPTQRVVRATLATLHERVVAQGLKPPTLIVVGDVVALSESLFPAAVPAAGLALAAD